MFEKEAEEYAGKTYEMCSYSGLPYASDRRAREQAFKDGAETALRKVVKYLSTLTLDENCGGYFSRLLESEENLQELAKELENV